MGIDLVTSELAETWRTNAEKAFFNTRFKAYLMRSLHFSILIQTLFYILPCFMGVAALGLLVVEFYFDDIERDLVAKGIVLTNGSRTFELMTRQTNLGIHVHLFNITNSENVTKFEAKPILQTVGPYVYESKITRTNITFTDECASKKCLQFSELTQLFFDVNKSSEFPENEKIVVPDIVKVGAKNIADKKNVVSGTFINFVLRTRKNFCILKASELMWGLDDSLLSLGSLIGMFKDSTVGLLRAVNNSIGGPYTVNTGENDITKIGQLEAYKNMKKLNTWASEYANMINGTTDVVSPPGLKLGEKRYVFSSLICRSLSFTATEAVFLKNLPQFKLLKMTLDKEQLQSVEENPDNLAFNDKDPEYPPSGFLSLTRCLNSPLPIFISMPYFHLVENETKNGVIFESPVEPNLEPYFLVDPKTWHCKEHVHTTCLLQKHPNSDMKMK
ncbi:hypothetical protein ACTXT7_016155 [Hymenolepis weldensis]